MKFYNYHMPYTDLCPGCLRFSIFIFSKTAGLIEIKLHMWDGGMKVCPWDLGQIIKMIAMPFKNFPLRTWKAEDLETWYAALGTLALPDLFKWLTIGWLWPILNMKSKQLIYWKQNFESTKCKFTVQKG